jgi:hypothetical protein
VFFNEEVDAYNIILLNSIKDRFEFPELKKLAMEEYRSGSQIRLSWRRSQRVLPSIKRCDGWDYLYKNTHPTGVQGINLHVSTQYLIS